MLSIILGENRNAFYLTQNMWKCQLYYIGSIGLNGMNVIATIVIYMDVDQFPNYSYIVMCNCCFMFLRFNLFIPFSRLYHTLFSYPVAHEKYYSLRCFLQVFRPRLASSKNVNLVFIFKVKGNVWSNAI